MEKLYVHKKLGPFCCECFLMNNLRGRSDSTFSFYRKNVGYWSSQEILMTETLRFINLTDFGTQQKIQLYHFKSYSSDTIGTAIHQEGY